MSQHFVAVGTVPGEATLQIYDRDYCHECMYISQYLIHRLAAQYFTIVIALAGYTIKLFSQGQPSN